MAQKRLLSNLLRDAEASVDGPRRLRADGAEGARVAAAGDRAALAVEERQLDTVPIRKRVSF
jgi:hypothetical protein